MSAFMAPTTSAAERHGTHPFGGGRGELWPRAGKPRASTGGRGFGEDGDGEGGSISGGVHITTHPSYTQGFTIVCPHTPCTTQIIFEEAVARAVAARMQQAITNQANQETAIPVKITPPSPLQQKFDALIMCNFTPRKPGELPVSEWVSFRRLFHLFKPHAPLDVWLMGPGNLKQLITEWYQKHSAFAGSVVWCKRLKNTDLQDGPGKFCYKFCFEYTPTEAPAPNGHSSSVSVPKMHQAGSSFSYLQYL